MTDYHVTSGETLSGVSLTQYDSMEVFSGGTAQSTGTFDSRQTVYAGGRSIGTNVYFLTVQDVFAGGSSIEDTIGRFGTQYLYGTSVDTDVDQDASQIVYGFATGSTIHGVLADKLYIMDAGQQQVYGTSQNTTLDGGDQRVYGTTTGTLVQLGAEIVLQGGTAMDTTVGHGDASLPAGFSALVLLAGATASGTITFSGLGSIEIDDPLQAGGTFAAPLVAFGGGDMIDLGGVTYSPATTATISGSTLTVASGSLSESFALQGATAGSVVVSEDAQGRTMLTGVAVPDAVSIAPTVTYKDGVFTLAGTASSVAGVSALDISAVLNDGTRQDLGAAAVGADGAFTFSDRIGANQQGFIEATLTDGAGVQTVSADPGFSLTGGLDQGAFKARQTSYANDGMDVTSTSLFRAGGSRKVNVQASDQTLTSDFFDTFDNHGAPSDTFVLNPNHGLDTISLFRVNGADHDSLSFKGADFDSTLAGQLAAVLANTMNTAQGALIVDPATGDAVRLVGIDKAELKANPGDFAFHA